MLMRDLAKRLRGGDFRRAVQAVAALRHLEPASAQPLVPSIEPPDGQRAFQVRVARLVAEGGVHGLASRWRELPSAEWRETLLSEIGQAFHLWTDEGTIELFLAGLEDPADQVARRAVSPLIECLRERPPRERKDAARTAHGKATFEAWDRAAAWMTPARRARVARAVTAALERHADNPKALTWPEAPKRAAIRISRTSPSTREARLGHWPGAASTRNRLFWARRWRRWAT